MKIIKFMGALALCASHASIAFAQTADDAVAEDGNDEAIVVTGTRIGRDGSQAPTPVTAVTAESLAQTAPSNIPDALNKLPQFTGSTSQNAGGTFNAGSAPLGNYLNLRGLGTARNLILLNGQRVPPTLNTNAVDANVLPQALVKRVDVVTGGVSAVYGSDAVSGAVNFVLDTDYSGLKGFAQTGISKYGDAFSYRYGAAVGKDLGDRIHVIASYERYQNDGVDSLFDRDWAHDQLSQQGGGANVNSAIRVFPNTRRCTATNGGLIVAGVLNPFTSTPGQCPNGVMFRPDGTLVRFDPGLPVLGGPNGTTVLNPTTSIGGDGGVQGEPRNGGASIAGTLDTHQGFGRLDFEVSDNLNLYVQGIYALSKTSFNSSVNSNVIGVAPRTITIFADNPYLRPEYQTALTNAGQASFVMGRYFNDIDTVKNRTSTEFYSAQIGLNGEVSGWEWDVNYVHGRADQKIAFNEFNTRNFYAAVDSARNAAGQIVCRVNLTSTVLPGCVPMNVLGDGNISTAAFNWARADSVYRYVNTMNYVNANIHGDLFDLPAGPVALAVGAEYREQKLAQTSNSDPAFFNDPVTGLLDTNRRNAYYAGIRGVPASALLFNSINVGLASGKQTVKEVYGELAIPILKDTGGFQDLSLDFAGRLTDYKTSGSVTTWKVGLNWVPIDGLRIRANRSRDIAAPNLNQLFAGQTVVFGQVFDPVTNNTVVPQIVSGGNPNLNPERADTTTIGIVAQPAFAPGLTLTVDAYRIKIDGAIGALSAQNILNDCFVSSTSPSCGLITRTNGALTGILASSANLAVLETQGIDIEASYRFDLLGGQATLRGFVNYLDRFRTQDAASQPVRDRVGRANLDNDGAGLPKWKGLLSQSWSNDRFGISFTERFTGTYDLGPPQQVWATNWKMPNRVYVDANINYFFDEDNRFEGFVNVQNLFNVKPPLVPGLITNLAPTADRASYDTIGTYFTAGVRVKF